jgi:cyclase
LIDQLAAEFGSQCVVLAIDTNWLEDSWRVYVHGGRTPTEKHTLAWAREAQERGVGEILLTSMIGDGTQEGFSVELTAAVADSLDIPVIASGGAGEDRTFHRGTHRRKGRCGPCGQRFSLRHHPDPQAQSRAEDRRGRSPALIGFSSKKNISLS